VGVRKKKNLTRAGSKDASAGGGQEM